MESAGQISDGLICLPLGMMEVQNRWDLEVAEVMGNPEEIAYVEKRQVIPPPMDLPDHMP